MVTVFEGLSREEVETFGLVLLSYGIVHQSVKQGSSWELRVEQTQAAEAETLIRDYQIENPEVCPAPEILYYDYKKSLAGVWGALLLAAVHLAVHTGVDGQLLKIAYAASAESIVSGEWYRAATALLLHADIVHLVGNMVGMAVFATAVCSITGWGVGWLLILASGISGNLINAYVYGYGHSSIGASTAVFGALGLLSSYQFLKKIQTPSSRFQVLLPLGAGLALLAFLGSSSHTDIMAHLFGFLSGVVLGLVYSGWVRYPFEWRWQAVALFCVIVVLITAWFRPILG